jgi:hypothetical protein
MPVFYDTIARLLTLSIDRVMVWPIAIISALETSKCPIYLAL